MAEDEDLPFDPLPSLSAGIDQQLAMAGNMARLLKGNYDAFQDEGFGDGQALWAAMAFMKGVGPPPD